MERYYSRLIETKIEKKSKSSGAVLVNGPKFYGKTTTCKLFKKNSRALISEVSGDGEN